MMEEKFDAEFKKKVKGINPEIPDLVRMRISDTLASLPGRRSWRKSGYLSAVAALFLVCFVGIRYIYPMQLTKKSAPESPQNATMATTEGVKDQGKQAKIEKSEDQNKQVKENNTMEDNVSENKSIENNTGNTTNPMLKAAPAPQIAGSSDATVGTRYGITSDKTTKGFALTSNDGKIASDQGIQLTLKTAIYDGKEIRIEFDKNSRGVVFADGVEQENDTVSNSTADNILRSAQVNVVENYDVRIVINNIPLKCSINVIETPLGENQYSGTMIIVPDSGLPEKLDIILSFDKIGDISGQWLLNTQVSKQ